MIKNGRPYTNENGCVDGSLITHCEPHEVREVGEWIKKNIRPARTIYCVTSYGLKHSVEGATNIYLTNNQFKDAMLLAGYKPVDPDELNWRYRIQFVDEFNNNPFLRWAKRFSHEDSPRGDFVRDASCANCLDIGFPVFADYSIILNYLYSIGACQEAIDAFDELWSEYSGNEQNGGCVKRYGVAEN